MPVPALIDDLNRANTSTGLGTSSSGGTWSDVTGKGQLEVISNTAGPESGTGCGATYSVEYGPTCRVQFTVSTRSTSSSVSDFVDIRMLGNNIGVGGVEDCYRFFFDCGDEFFVTRVIDGTPTTLVAVGSRTAPSGTTLCFEAIKRIDRVTLNVYKNDVLSDTYDDVSGSRITTAGQISISCGATPTDWRLDDIRAETFSPPPDPPTIVEVGTDTISTNQTCSPAWTSAVEIDDLLIAVGHSVNDLTNSLSFPGGWTEINEQSNASGTGGDCRAAWAWKWATSGDSAGGSVTITRTGSATTVFQGLVISIRGANTAFPINANTQNVEATATPTIASVNTTVQSCLVLGINHEGDDNLFSGQDAPWVEVLEQADATDAGTDICVNSMVQTSIGATPTTTLTKSGTDGIISWTIAIAPSIIAGITPLLKNLTMSIIRRM